MALILTTTRGVEIKTVHTDNDYLAKTLEITEPGDVTKGTDPKTIRLSLSDSDVTDLLHVLRR